MTSQTSPARARASLHISDLSPQNCSSLSPGARHAIILPTHGRLYTIIGPLKRGTIHICLRRRTIADPRHRREAEIQLPGIHLYIELELSFSLAFLQDHRGPSAATDLWATALANFKD